MELADHRLHAWMWFHSEAFEFSFLYPAPLVAILGGRCIFVKWALQV